ncbi:MAG: PAS domain S-box protein [Deltaproteobacteria bacterium]|nr:PAS domain S-box protein [Deltaproteobacteria bacterium]
MSEGKKIRPRLRTSPIAKSAETDDPAPSGSDWLRGAFFDASSNIVWAKDLDGRFLIVNRRTVEVLGLPEDRIIGRTVHDLFGPKLADDYSANDREAVEAGHPVPFEERAMFPDGEHTFWSLKFPIRDPEGGIAAVGAICTDITAQIQHRRALMDSEAKFRSYIRHAPVGVLVADSKGRHVEANRAAETILGFGPGEILDVSVAEIPVLEDRDKGRRHFQRVQAEGYAEEVIRLRRKSGGTVWARLRAVKIDQDRFLATIEDLTARLETERALREIEETFRLITENMTDMVWITDLDFRVVFASPSVMKLRGFTMEELRAMPLERQVTPESLGHLAETIAREVTPERLADPFASILQTMDLEFVCKDRSTIWVEARTSLLRNPDGTPRGFLGLGRDITERRRLEAKIRHQEILLREAVEIAHLGAWEFDPVTRDGSWTDETARIHDLEPGTDISASFGMSFYEGESKEKIEAAVNAAIERGTPYDLELEMVTAKGARKWVRTICHPVVENGKVLRVRGSFQDISERKRAEAENAKLQGQLAQAAKMEAIGQLAGGVAHDFNNLLTAIRGFADLIHDALHPGDPLRADVSEIQNAADSAAKLTQQLLAFSRRQIIAPRVLDLNEVIASAEKMIRRLIGEDIDLLFTPSRSLGTVLVDPGQIEQILVNLSVNARDAMPHGGKLTFEVTNVALDESHCQVCDEIIRGNHVLLAVSDTGIGMDEQTRMRIFEPFFTTKEKGRGTGLGLATVLGIVHQNRGHINVYSEPERGTTFKVYLPRVHEQPVEVPLSTDPGPTEGGETILLVEDLDLVRRLAKRTLEERGYTVLEAGHGGEALIVAEHHAGTIDLLVADVVMPQLGGRQLYERLRVSRPDMHVLYMSGYTENAIAHHGILEPGTNFIGKPFQPKDFARKVREVLDA